MTFKVGDRVARKCGWPFADGTFVGTIEYIESYWADIEGHVGAIRLSELYHVYDQEPAVTAPDIVTKPSHYTKHPIEPITFIMRNGFEFWRGNIIKYASRAGSKHYEDMDEVQSEITDLEKVRRYAEMRINQLKGEAIL